MKSGLKEMNVTPLTSSVKVMRSYDYRPYKDESEVPMVVRFRRKGEETVYSLEKISRFGLHINGMSYGFKAAFESLEQTINGRDWTPAGVEEGK